MSNSTLPPNNLPPKSIPWGRRLQNSIVSTWSSTTAFLGDLYGQNRNNATNVGALGRRIEDLQSRASYYTSIPLSSVSVSMPNIFDPYPYQGSVSIPVPIAPDGALRRSLIFVSFYTYNSYANGNMIGTTLPVMSSTDMPRPVSLLAMSNPLSLSAPAGFRQTGHLFSEIIPSGANVTIGYGGTASRADASQTTVNMGISDINVSVIYGERVS